MKGLGPRKSVDKLSEDEEVEVSMSDDLAISISRNRCNGSDSLGNSSTTPDKKSMDTHSSELSRNGDDDDEEEDDDDDGEEEEEEEGHEEVATFQRGTSNSSFSRRSSLRTAVRDKRSSRRNYSLKKKRAATNATKAAPEVQLEPQQASCWPVEAKRHAASIPSPCSSLSSVSIMSATAPVAHPKATDFLPPSVRAEDLRLNLNSLDSSSACSDFKSMEANSLDIVESTRL